ncbi:hypothetical protein BRD15_08465 [Halobacteriales archaeon SW_6_65_15]|nr:MAG: hypothetical protein BRD15_08465 [Halobacteriales archaeon SW_6_65_15]
MSDASVASDRSKSTETFGYPRSAVATDLATIAAVGLVLVAIHVLVPQSLQDYLAFDHGAFAPESLLAPGGLAGLTLRGSQFDNLLTAAYVHANRGHLLSNLGGYVSLSLVTYLICLQADRRRWFRRTFPLFLVVLPVAVNLTSYVVLESRFPTASPISRGFSGVVAGFGGFLLAAVAVHLRTNYSRETVFFVSQFAILLLLGADARALVRRRPLSTGGVRPALRGPRPRTARLAGLRAVPRQSRLARVVHERLRPRGGIRRGRPARGADVRRRSTVRRPSRHRLLVSSSRIAWDAFSHVSGPSGGESPYRASKALSAA